ncbi:MAG: TAXI family TRAP transporter solute-binding subunit [Pseudobdellovibrionaceae bacterium]
MNKKIWLNYSLRDLLVSILPVSLLVITALIIAIQYLAPAPPNHLTISTGEEQSDIQEIAKDYQDLLKQDGVQLEIHSSNGPLENLHRLEDDKSGVSAAFVQDGLGSPKEQPDVVSLGSLYYEPIWIFYRDKKEITHFSQLEGKKIAIGRVGHGTEILARRLFKLSALNSSHTTLVNIDAKQSAEALKKGDVDAAILLLAPDNPLIHDLALQRGIRLMNVAQAEAISRRDAAFHHLVLPRGALDLEADNPDTDINIISSTATLLVRDDLHPALAYLLLKAASEIHSTPGIFEKRNEFPMNKDDAFPLSDDALQYYKSGGPFWQRYLPYWLAAWFDRFVLLVIPFLAFVLPLLRLIPKIYNWRLRSRIYQRYGELKYLETQITSKATKAEYTHYSQQLDHIEDRVNKMKMPQNFAEYIYSLKGHIQFVRDRLEKSVRIEN